MRFSRGADSIVNQPVAANSYATPLNSPPAAGCLHRGRAHVGMRQEALFRQRTAQIAIARRGRQTGYN